MSVSPFFLGDDTALVAEMDRRQRLRRVADRTAQRMGPDVADRVGRLASAYPWLEPGVHLSLAAGGVEPDQPVAQFAAQGSIYANRYRGMGGYQVGEEVSAETLAGGKGAPPLDFTWAGPRMPGGQKGLQPSTVATALGHAVESRSVQADLSREGQNVIAEQAYGPGAAERSDAAREVVADQGVRPAVRGATILLDTPYQSLQAQYRTVFRNDVSLWSGSRIPTPGGVLGQTTLGQTIDAFREGDSVDLGTGVFVDPDSQIERDRRAEARQYGTVGGHIITPGRQAAAQVFEPGTDPFNVVSGAVDAAVAIFGDPLNLVFGVGSGSRGLRAGAAAADDVADASRLADDVAEQADELGPLIDDADETDIVSRAVAESATATDEAAEGSTALQRIRDAYNAADETARTIANPVTRRRAAGAIDGTRRFADPQAFTAWLNGRHGTRLQQWLADQDSLYDIWSASGRQWRAETVRALRDADSPEAVRAILEAGGGVTTPTPIRIKPASRSRWGYDTPGEAVDLDDIEAAMVGFERTARNARVDEDVLRQGFEELVTADGRTGRFEAFRNLFSRIEEDLVSVYGLDKRDAHRITRMWEESENAGRAYAQDGLSLNAWHPQMLADEAFDPSSARPMPLFDSEFLNSPVPLPDFRTLRRATSSLNVRVPWGDSRVNISRLLLEQGGASRQGLLGQSAKEWALTHADDSSTAPIVREFFGANPDKYRLLWDGLLGFTTFAFKPAALLRPAWTARVVLMDEAARMAAAGLDGLYSHPLSYISWLIGRRGGTTPAGARWKGVPEFDNAMYRDGGPFLDLISTAGQRIIDQRVVNRGEDLFARGIADRIATMHASIVGRNTARAQSLDDALRWFNGEHVPTGLVDDAGNPQMLTESAEEARRILGNGGGDWARIAPDADDPEAARRYLEVVSEQIRLHTGGNDELLEAVRTGRFRGVDVIVESAENTPGRLNDEFVRALRDMFDADGIADTMPRQVRVSVPRHATMRNRGANLYNTFVRKAFAALGAYPSNYLSRSPVFRQAYTGEMTRLIGWMDDSARARWLAYAEGEGNLGRGFVHEIKTAMRSAVGDVDFDTADAVARAYALQATEELLYSMHKRGQVADALRLVFPFGEAWKEMITTWGKLLTRRPQTARTIEHALENNAQDGFFSENEWGEQVFSYPMTGALTEMITGAGGGPGTPMPLTGRVQGLSMATEAMPGVGPVVQIPAAWFLEGNPRYDPIAEQILPYGSTASWQEIVTPRFFQRIATAASVYPSDSPVARAARWMADPFNDPEQQRTYDRSVHEVMTYLATTGEYDQTPAGITEMTNDARRYAAQLFMFRGVMTAFAPSAPAPEFQMFVDPDGPGGETAELASSQAVATWFHERRRESPDTAVGDFIERFGPDAFLAMQTSTVSISVGAPVTTEGLQWVLDHPGVDERLPYTYGLFAPTEGEFDSRAYERQLRLGEREILSPEQFAALGANLIGSYLYRQARDEALQSAYENGASSLSENQRLWLKDYRERLIEEFPGYDPEGVPGTTSTPTTNQLVRELMTAVDDPAVRDTDAGRALAEYLRYRQQAADVAESATGDPDAFRTRNDGAAIRGWLRGHAEDLIRRYPAFAQIWDRVLDHELDEDLDEEVTS